MYALGIIPARGGSKSVPRKNIRLVGGRPLIAYTIEAAQRSALLAHYVVSTDDIEIAGVARDCGSPILMRPPELAADETPTLPVVRHALAELRQPFDVVVVLQPTTPLRLGADIDRALRLLDETGADSIVSVYQVSDHHPARMYRLEQGRLVPYEAGPPARLRQELPTVYHRNGAIYACRRRVIDELNTLVGPDSRPYIMPRDRSLNVDDEFDLAVADRLLRHPFPGE
jgi:CMP-N-acetylneuraminic acid synthetase